MACIAKKISKFILCLHRWGCLQCGSLHHSGGHYPHNLPGYGNHDNDDDNDNDDDDNDDDDDDAWWVFPHLSCPRSVRPNESPPSLTQTHPHTEKSSSYTTH